MGAVMADRQARFLEKIAKPDEMMDEMLQRMCGIEGAYEGLPAICRAWDVPYGRVMNWLMADVERYALYQRGLEVQAKALVSEAVEIADNAATPVIDPTTGKPMLDDKGKVVLVETDVQRDKLRVDTRFRVAKHHDNKVYGEKVEHTGMTAPVFNVVIQGALPAVPGVIQGAVIEQERGQVESRPVRPAAEL